MSIYQATHFNRHFSINGTEVGGMTAQQALSKMKSVTLANKVFVGSELIIDGKDTKTQFSEKDLSAFRELLKQQYSFFPSFRARNSSLIPVVSNVYRGRVLKKQVIKELQKINQKLKAPVDARASLTNGRIVVLNSRDGEQFDISRLMKEYDHQEYNSSIHLQEYRLQPVRENSQIVKDEKAHLRQLQTHSLTYALQNQPYQFRAADLIKNASISKKMNLSLDLSGIKEKLAAINQSQSTLNKNFVFRTHSGSVISVPGQSYGWALQVSPEADRIAKALEKGQSSVKAYNVYGLGYSTYGIGYHNTTNHGIGNTYVEVSISAQRIWLYKNGKMVLTTNVVTGRHDTHEDTPKGVWYIMYKQSPSLLVGSEAGDANYKVKVHYWAPFTMGGCGFHDAYWRHNWSGNAYLTQGSGGCVNTPPSVMKSVYDNVQQNEPVVIY